MTLLSKIKHVYQYIRTKLTNTLLKLGNLERYFGGDSNGRAPFLHPDYQLVFKDDFKKRNKKNWLLGMSWGANHPNDKYQWMSKDEDFYSWDEDGANFRTRNNPKELLYIDKMGNEEMMFKQTEHGIINSKTWWKYGYFEVSAKLPVGKELWPAIWLTGSLTWPPEIDILEAYSGKNGKYKPWKAFQSNIHYRKVGQPDTEKEMIRATSHVVNTPTERFVKYGVLWEEDQIEIYYDGYLVSVEYRKSVLDRMHEGMIMVLGNGIRNDIEKGETNFRVNSMKVWQKKSQTNGKMNW